MANEIPKNFSMSFAELSVYANQLVTFMLRDLDDFAKFGITTTQTDALQALQDAFQEIPTDEKYQSDATTARVIRDEARELLIDKMDDIALRFRLAFPEGHSPLNQFDISDLSGVDDSNVLLKARNLNSKLPLYAAQLLPHGQTPTVTTEFEETVQDFEDKIRAHISAISKRTQGTEDRTKAGNYLYEFVVDYTDMGKRLYQKKSPAKYQDYIIYGSTPAVAVHGAPSGLHFLDETTLSWTEIDNATSYGVSVSSDGGSHWQADIFTSANYTNVPILSVGKLYYRVRGRNSVGYGEYSGTFEKLFGLSTVENFFYSDNQFTWNPVEFANGYDIQYSLSGEENWVLVFNGNATSFDHTPASGSWTYRIRASYGSIKSEWVELAVEGV